MSITDRYSNASTAALGAAGANTLEAIARRWSDTSRGIRKALAGIRDPRRRADIQQLVDTYWSRKAPEAKPLPGEPKSLPAEETPLPAEQKTHRERAEALAEVCEALLRQFDDDQAGAAEIRLVVHKRDELPTEPMRGPGPPDARSAVDADDEELVFELRRLLASSGGTIADVAHALERRGDDVDREGRELLEDEVRAVEVEIAILKTLLFDPVEWDWEFRRLLADEVAPFEDHVVDDDLVVDEDHDDEDD